MIAVLDDSCSQISSSSASSWRSWACADPGMIHWFGISWCDYFSSLLIHWFVWLMEVSSSVMNRPLKLHDLSHVQLCWKIWALNEITQCTIILYGLRHSSESSLLCTNAICQWLMVSRHRVLVIQQWSSYTHREGGKKPAFCEMERYESYFPLYTMFQSYIVNNCFDLPI